MPTYLPRERERGPFLAAKLGVAMRRTLGGEPNEVPPLRILGTEIAVESAVRTACCGEDQEMLWLKGCPRCHGDLFLERDIGASYVVCIQCGYTLNEAQEQHLKLAVTAHAA